MATLPGDAQVRSERWGLSVGEAGWRLDHAPRPSRSKGAVWTTLMTSPGTERLAEPGPDIPFEGIARRLLDLAEEEGTRIAGRPARCA